MSRRVTDLFDLDRKAREGMIVVAMAVTFITALVFLSMGTSLTTVQVLAAIVGVSGYFSQVAIYKYGPKIKRKRSQANVGNWKKSLVAIGGAVSVALAIVIVSPSLQAAVLNKRLQAILHSDEPVSKKTIEATKALTYAAKYHVKIRPDVEFEMAAQSVADKSLINKIQVQGDSTNWANYIAKVNAKYDLQQPKTFSFRLDGQQTSYTTIAGGQVVYNGGNLSLESVHFENVTFDIDDNENGRRFAQALLNSTNGSVSINLQNANADHPKKID